MKKKRLLTLDDLYNFYSAKGKSVHFNAKDDDDRIVIQVQGNLKFDNDNKDIEGLLPVTLQSCHINKNLNGSFISEESMTSALPSFSNRPILGYIYKDDNGDYQFRDHAMHIDENDELVYDEVPVGVIPESCNAHLLYDEKKEKTYVVVDGYIFEEYSRAKEILEREKECAVSVELAIRELSYNAKDKVMNLEDFYFSGVTVLGRWEDGSDVLPGMEGANIKISDFKQKNNATFSESNMIEMLEQISNKLDQLAIDNSKGKEEQTMDEENVKVTETSEEEVETTEEVVTEEETTTEEVTTTEESSEEVTVTEAESEEVSDVTPSKDEEKFTKTFEISHEDIRYALYNLLSPFEEEDNDWYGITAVYDDWFVYEGWFDADHKFKQAYKRDGDNVSFEGERVHMNVEYLTDEELEKLNEMRSNYAKFEEMSKELDRYHAEPDKQALLDSEDYSQIRDTEQYTELVNNHFEIDTEDLAKKLDEILLDYAKKNKIESATFSADEMPKVGMKKIPIQAKKKSGSGRYGNIFVKKD